MSPTPPQLQLLSRYIGSFGVDAELFGAITRTFFLASSGSGGAMWNPDAGEVVVFDGIESARTVATAWYSDRMSEAEAGRLAREDEARANSSTRIPKQSDEDAAANETRTAPPPAPAPSFPPQGVEIIEGPPIHDRGSSFVARVCRITHPDQVTSPKALSLPQRQADLIASPGSFGYRTPALGSTYFASRSSNDKRMAL